MTTRTGIDLHCYLLIMPLRLFIELKLLNADDKLLKLVGTTFQYITH